MERAVVEKKPVPEIDFTLHTMEDGAEVSTQERVCKGMCQTVSSQFRLLTCGQKCRHQPCNHRHRSSSGHLRILRNQTFNTSNNIFAEKAA